MNGLADMLSGAKKMVQLKAQQVMQAVGVSAETKDLEYDGVRDEFLRLNEQLKKVCLLAAQLVKDMRSQANSQKELLGFMADVFERDDDAGQPAMNVFRIVSAGSKAALLEVGNKLELEVCSPIQKNLENLNPKVKLRMDERKKLQLALDHYKEKLQGLSRDDQSRALRNDSKSAEAFHMFQRSNDEIVLWLKSINASRMLLLLKSQSVLVHALVQSGSASSDASSQLVNDLKLLRDIVAIHAAKVAELESTCGRPGDSIHSASTAAAAPNSIYAQQLQQQQPPPCPPQRQTAAVSPQTHELNIFGQPVSPTAHAAKSIDDIFASSSPAGAPVHNHLRSQSAGDGALADLLGLGPAAALSPPAAVSSSSSSSNDLLGLLSSTSPRLAPQVPLRRKSIETKPQGARQSSNDDFMNSFQPTCRRKSIDKKGVHAGIDLLGFDAPTAVSRSNSGGMDDLLGSFASTPKSASSHSPISPGGVNSAFLVMNDDDRQKHVATEAIHSDFKAKVRVSTDSRSIPGVRAEIQQQFQQHIQQQAQEAAAKVRAMQAEEEALKEQKREVAGGMVQRVEAWAGRKGMRKNVQAMINNFQQVLWPGANWTPVSLSELMTPAQVKKHHRKAIMVVHPDKVSCEGVEVQALAQQIFTVLTEAMQNLK